MPPWTLDEYAETRIAQRISMVSGVAQVQVLGSQKYAVHAQLDPHALAARQIGINEVETALSELERQLADRHDRRPAQGVHAAGHRPADERRRSSRRWSSPTATARRCGSRSSATSSTASRIRGPASWFYTHDAEQRAITLGIQRQPGTNTIAVADAVKALLPQFQAELPASVHMDVLYDRSDTIRESYRDVQFTMVLTLGLVILVIFVFLRNVWATVIPSLALPFSIIGTFAVMYMLGYSLDNLSMMALILSVGFVVDDAIVMLENIYRHVEMGEDPLTASLVGSREIGFTIVSMTLSLAAVFIPVLFMGGVLGRLFREFSVTICVAILISGVVSVTLTPMLCSRFLKKPSSHGRAAGRRRPQRLERVFNWLLGAATTARCRSCCATGRRRWSRSAVRARSPPARCSSIVPEGLHPRAGHRSDCGDDRSGAGHGVRQAGRVSGPRRRHHPARPERRRRWCRRSAAPPRRRSAARTSDRSSSTSSRAASASELANDIIERLRPRAGRGRRACGCTCRIRRPIRIGGQVSKSLYQFSMQSPDRPALYAAAAKLEKRAARRARTSST